MADRARALEASVRADDAATDRTKDLLRRHGFELKNGHVYAPDRLTGTLEPLWNVSALDRESGKHVALVRASMEPRYERAWWRWVTRAASVGEAFSFNLLDSDEQKALLEGQDQAGGFIIPAELAAEVVSVRRSRSLVRKGATVLPTMRDRLDVGWGDWSAEWVGEIPAAGETSGNTVRSLSVTVFKLRAKAYASRDLFDDAQGLAAYVREVGAAALADAEDSAFVAGSGVGRPLGFVSDQLPSTSKIDVEGSTANEISNTTAAAGSRAKLESLEADLPDNFRRNARWFMRGSVLAKVRGLVTPAGTLAFLSTVGPDGEDYLMSHPVSTSSAMPADGTNGALPIALVDLSRFVIADRATISLRIDRETRADVDQVVLNLFSRVGACLSVADAVRVGQV